MKVINYLAQNVFLIPSGIVFLFVPPIVIDTMQLRQKRMFVALGLIYIILEHEREREIDR